jgi:hypothetical protein
MSPPPQFEKVKQAYVITMPSVCLLYIMASVPTSTLHFPAYSLRMHPVDGRQQVSKETLPRQRVFT